MLHVLFFLWAFVQNFIWVKQYFHFDFITVMCSLCMAYLTYSTYSGTVSFPMFHLKFCKWLWEQILLKVNLGLRADWLRSNAQLESNFPKFKNSQFSKSQQFEFCSIWPQGLNLLFAAITHQEKLQANTKFQSKNVKMVPVPQCTFRPSGEMKLIWILKTLNFVGFWQFTTWEFDG